MVRQSVNSQCVKEKEKKSATRSKLRRHPAEHQVHKKHKTTTTIKYGHADGHSDKYLLWHQMTLEQQMNVICDGEANMAVARSIDCAFQ